MLPIEVPSPTTTFGNTVHSLPTKECFLNRTVPPVTFLNLSGIVGFVNNARRKVDGRMEARIVEIACGPVPEGHARWTIRLLENQAKIEFDEPISREAIRRTLKKTGLDLTAANTGAYQTKQTQNS